MAVRLSQYENAPREGSTGYAVKRETLLGIETLPN
jgi:hypothetical protein